MSAATLQAGAAADVLSVREKLFDAGFRPVPISNPEAKHSNAGKAPFEFEWQHLARRDPPDALRIRRMDALNTGILCDGLRALDIDVDDAELAHRIRAMALLDWGETLLRVRDNSPRCLLLYRAAEGEPPKRQLIGKRGKVEILGLGNQFVGYGRHPSGAALRWMPEPPHLAPRDQLPAVTEDQITRFFVAIAPLLEATAEPAAGAVKPEDPAELRAVLEALTGMDAAGLTELSQLPPDAQARLQDAFGRSRRACDRWHGLADDLIGNGKDHSRTGMDMSLAALLKRTGAAPLDAALALLAYPHGAARDQKKHPTAAQQLRYAAKTALRAGQPKTSESVPPPEELPPMPPDFTSAEAVRRPNGKNAPEPAPYPLHCPANDTGRSRAERPVIRVEGGNLPDEVQAAEAALIAADLGMYQRGGFVMRTGLVPVEISEGRKVMALSIVRVGKHALTEAFTRAARWQRYDGRTKGHKDINAPAQIAETYLQKSGLWKLPPLYGVLSAPTLRPDGSILEKPGYDEATGLLFDPCGQAFPPIPPSPTKADASAALGKLKNLISTFPFGGKPNNPGKCADRSVALSCLLTATIRRSLDTAPLHGFTAPAAGTGKSKLADLASVIVTGREAGIVTPHPDPNEFEKRLGAMQLAAEPVIAIDNVAHPLGGEALCSAITQKRVRIRILGLSEMPEVLSNSLLTANGNNLVLAGDMSTRRAVLCTLDAQCEYPELREFANEPVTDAKRDRAELVVAALTVLRAYHVAGRPQATKAFGGQEPWSRWVRAALIWLGEADPVDTVENIRAANPEMEVLVAVLTEWKRKFFFEARQTRQVADAADKMVAEVGSSRQVYENQDLRNALLSIGRVGKGGVINSRALASWLQSIKGNIVRLDAETPVRLVIDGHTDGVARWKLENVGGASQP